MFDMLNLDDLRQVGTKQAVNVAGYTLIFGLLFTIASIVGIAVIGKFDALWIAALVFAAFGLLAFAGGLAIFMLNIGQSRDIVTRAVKMLDREIEQKYPAPPSAPSAPTGSALPPAPLDETAETSRAGELELNGTPRLIHGFPAATLMWLCDYLAKGNEWTESQLKNMPVPHLFPTVDFGKSDRKKNTPYTRLFDSERGIFVRAGIIVERGGEGNDKGRLAIKSPLTMMQALKDLDTEQ